MLNYAFDPSLYCVGRYYFFLFLFMNTDKSQKPADLRNEYPNKLRLVDKNTWSGAPVKRDDMGIMIQGRYVMEK